jgi:hypothetical protein
VISAVGFPLRCRTGSGHNPEVANEVAEPQPTGRDYGCGLVALIAAVLLVGSVVGAIVELLTDGLSFTLAITVTFNLLFCYWIAMGAWRRTTWSSRP